MAQIALYGKPMRHAITCLNGRFLRADRATVPVTDRGFRFGDGVFETIRLEQGVPFQWDLHLARLTQGLSALRIEAPDLNWQTIAQKLITKNRANCGFLRLAISRGTGSAGYLPHNTTAATWVMEYIPPLPLPTKPYRLWQSSHIRAPLSALPGNQKLAQGLTSTLALLEAKDHGCEEALLLTPEGAICSSASANIFWIKDNTVYTPPLATGCLDGTTRHCLQNLSPITEIEAPVETLAHADAVFLANSRLGLWPVTVLAPQGTNYPTDTHLFLKLRLLYYEFLTIYYTENKVTWRIHS